MAGKIVLIDTSVLIDHFRKKDKSKTYLFNLSNEFSAFKISVITEFEIYSGATSDQLVYWDELLKQIDITPLDSLTIQSAIDINAQLKKDRKQIAIADLFIAATAVHNNLPVATLNVKHFNRIEDLILV